MHASPEWRSLAAGRTSALAKRRSMKAPLSPAFLLLGVVVSFASIASGAAYLLTQVSPGPARLVVHSDVMPECDGPGHVVVGGRDWDRNGELGEDESETMALVCAVGGAFQVPCEEDELDGAFDAEGRPRHRLRVLLGFGDRAADDDCALGGLEVRAGVDRNGDGSLAAGEVSETRVLCGRPGEPVRAPEDARYARSR
jgi:hypothetical protein